MLKPRSQKMLGFVLEDKVMKKIIPIIITFLLLLSSLDAFAKMETYIKEYTYPASDIDSKVSCRTNATEQVKRNLLEELGTYLESHTMVKNYQITNLDFH